VVAGAALVLAACGSGTGRTPSAAQTAGPACHRAVQLTRTIAAQGALDLKHGTFGQYLDGTRSWPWATSLEHAQEQADGQLGQDLQAAQVAAVEIAQGPGRSTDAIHNDTEKLVTALQEVDRDCGVAP
jgi:hypothetical protein